MWCCLVCASSCANVRFEKSPYSIRGLDVVYSKQEDMTFLSWRLRQSAEPDNVEFELYLDGAYRPIDINDTYFAAEPYECEQYYLCFQYQVEGDYQWPEEIERPMRSIHKDEGLYAGPEPRIFRPEITFGIDPIALGRNEEIDPRRFDWFELQQIPLQRSYSWQLTGSARRGYLTASVSEGECAAPDEDAWKGLGTRAVPEDEEWIEQPVCMAARPVRRDDQGVVRNVPFAPAPMLAIEQQDYVPPEERPPVIYLYLIDTLVRSQTRCDRAINGIVGQIDKNFGSRAPDSVRLGSFTPLDPQSGRPLSGCDQRADQDYPVRQMLELIKEAAAQLYPQHVRMVLVYINNVDLPPSTRVLEQLDELLIGVSSIDKVSPYGYAIGSNTVLSLTEWNDSTGWRPIDDETFLEDIKAWGDVTLPFRTMLHEPNTPIQINRPVLAEDKPRYFKICDVTPDEISSVGLPSSRVVYPAGLDYYVWPAPDKPDYLITLESQLLVPNTQYTRVRVSVQVETCERFCDHPFRTAGQQDLDNWQDTARCQWL